VIDLPGGRLQGRALLHPGEAPLGSL